MARSHFRTATTADARMISELVNSAYRGESSKAGWTTEAHLLGGNRIDTELVREMISEPGVRIELLFGEQNALLGCVYLRFANRMPCYLGLLTVRPDIQSKGLGKELLLHSEKVAREKKYSEIRITVIPSRTELIAFYERRGYVRTGHSEPFPDGEPRIGIPKVEGLRLDEWVKKLDSGS